MITGATLVLAYELWLDEFDQSLDNLKGLTV